MNTKSLRAGDFAEDILRKYSDMVYQLALSQLKNKADAEDVFQEVFVKFIESVKTFESDEHIKAWLIRVTVNCCKKLRSTAWFRHNVPLKYEHINTLCYEKNEKSDVYYAILELPPKYRTIIHLFYYEDMSLLEISNALNMKVSTITSQLSRARNLLRKNLKGDYDYE